MAWEPDYITGEELAVFARAKAGDDPYVDSLATAASRAVDGWCNRQFGQLDAPATFTYDAAVALAGQAPGGRWLVAVDDIGDVTGLAVTVDGAAVTAGADGYTLWPRNAVAKGGVYTHLLMTDVPAGDIAVTARFGWPAFPASVVAATRLQGTRWHARRESPYGTTGSPVEGTELRLSSRLDPDVRALLRGPHLVRARRPR